MADVPTSHFARDRKLVSKLSLPALAGALLVGLLVIPQQSFAALGDSVASVESDRVRMRGQVRATHTSTYDVHEITGDIGTKVREFSAGGRVFGVAWQGHALPDLKQILGTHYQRFAEAAKQHKAHGAPLIIHDGNLVIESGGRMRHFTGRAYLTDTVPQGVRLAEIQ